MTGERPTSWRGDEVILNDIASETGLAGPYVHLVARTASHRYKTYQIPKATGGFRTIDHPARELKFLQAWIVTRLLGKLPVHDAAYAYRRGRNILAHASLHTGNNYLLKVDFRDFFPSILYGDVIRVLEENASLSPYPYSLRTGIWWGASCARTGGSRLEPRVLR